MDGADEQHPQLLAHHSSVHLPCLRWSDTSVPPAAHEKGSFPSEFCPNSPNCWVQYTLSTTTAAIYDSVCKRWKARLSHCVTYPGSVTHIPSYSDGKRCPQVNKKPQQTSWVLLCVPLIKYICIVILQLCFNPKMNNCLMLSTACICMSSHPHTLILQLKENNRRYFKAAHTVQQQFIGSLHGSSVAPQQLPMPLQGTVCQRSYEQIYAQVVNPTQKHTGIQSDKALGWKKYWLVGHPVTQRPPFS